MRSLASRFVVVVLVASFFAGSLPAAAGTAELVADLNLALTFSSEGGARELLAALGDRLLFTAYEPSSGNELWISDGTPLGTRLLLDLTPGGESSHFHPLGTIQRTAVLLRDVGFGVGPWDLWRSDGTVEGTVPIYDLSPLESCSFGDFPEAAIAGKRLFFLARPGAVGCELWTTDGTAAGTRSVAELESGAHDLVAAGTRVFFSTRTGLWTSDGDGTVLVRGFASGEDGPRRLLAAGSRVVFLAEAVGGGGEELWTSDGTAAGTRALTQFFELDPFGFSPLPEVIGETLYFTADDGTGTDLWRVESAGGTPRRVTDFVAGAPFGESFGSDQLAALGNRLIFAAHEERENPSGRLWVSGGTPESTAPIEGCAGGCPTLPSALQQVGSRIVFRARGSNGGDEVWATDGTGAGTRRLGVNSGFWPPVALLGRAFFIGPGSGGGAALWKTDGTPGGTVRVADLGGNPFGGSSSTDFAPVAVGGRIFFRANLEFQPQLWVSDGSPTGTRVLSNIGASPSSSPSGFTAFAAGALFRAHDGDAWKLWRTDATAGTYSIPAVDDPLAIVPTSGRAVVLAGRDRRSGPFALWGTDGTEAGTFRIDPPGSQPLGILAPFGGRAIFGAEADDRLSLWESDGTAAGTRRLFDLPADLVGVHSLQRVGSRLYFAAQQEPLEQEQSIGYHQLWVSDGTPAGTRALVGEGAVRFAYQPAMTLVGQTVFFADDYGLWKTDGTAAGTADLPLPQPEFDSVRPTDLTELNGALYFTAWTPQGPTHRGLWRSDGTPAGTYLVKAVGVPEVNSFHVNPVRMARAGGRLVFAADDGTHGAELWSTDGTAAGTTLLRDIAPGEASSLPALPSSFAAAAGKVYFAATDGRSGFELWESDGTAGGTRRVQDIAPGAHSASPDALTVTPNGLFFAADDGVHGVEPWVLPLGGGGCVPSAVALCLGGRFRVEADWRDFGGQRGRGHAVPISGDTGTFWFFDAANVEVILKVLDGRGLNGHHWVFYGALSSVQYTLTVTDTQSGAVRRYFNPAGWLGSLADTEAFGPRGASAAGVVTEGPRSVAGGARVAARAAAAAGSCVPSAERLCLNGRRFAVEARWRTTNGATGAGRAVPLAGGDTGYLWFFAASNVEVVLKVLDGRPVNGKFWVFYGALSDVEYTLTVTDTQTGAVKTYTNLQGRLASVADTGAF